MVLSLPFTGSIGREVTRSISIIVVHVAPVPIISPLDEVLVRD